MKKYFLFICCFVFTIILFLLLSLSIVKASELNDDNNIALLNEDTNIKILEPKLSKVNNSIKKETIILKPYNHLTINEKNELVVGDIKGSYNGFPIYENGDVYTSVGKSYSHDGYYYGYKWQCIEFVKRYYYDRYNHMFPNKWGHAKDYFNTNLNSGEFNNDRGLYQYNASDVLPNVDDIIVFNGNYGHIAIVSRVTEDSIFYVQQNTDEIEDSISYEKSNDGIIINSFVFGYLSLNKKNLD